MLVIDGIVPFETSLYYRYNLYDLNEFINNTIWLSNQLLFDYYLVSYNKN